MTSPRSHRPNNFHSYEFSLFFLSLSLFSSFPFLSFLPGKLGKVSPSGKLGNLFLLLARPPPPPTFLSIRFFGESRALMPLSSDYRSLLTSPTYEYAPPAMFALRSAQPMLVTTLRRSPKVLLASSSAMIDTPPSSSASGIGQDQQHHQQQLRNYGRACPAVRRHAAKKKRDAAAAAPKKKTGTYATTAEAQAAAAAAEAMTVASIANLRVASPDGDGPSMEIAKSMPISFKNMDNISLLTLSALKVEQARGEMLRRHIMTVDNVPYSEACKTFDEIAAENRKGMLWHTIPYKVGITAAVGGGIFSVPLCFHLPTVHWFNEAYVTTDVPEPQDLETWLEVGSWAWNWMEPPLGQISFFLLCLQFARSQISNLGVRPYTAKIKAMRANKIVAKYPQYDATLLSNYSKSVSFYN